MILKGRLRTLPWLLLGALLALAITWPILSLGAPAPSHEGGWRAIGPEGGYIRALGVSPAFAIDHTLFAGTSSPAGTCCQSGGGFRSTDGGDSWQQFSQVLTETSVLALGLSPAFASDGTIFASTRAGVFRSIDRGNTWQQLTSTSAGFLGLSPAFATDDTLFMGASGGVVRSTDRGDTWQQVNQGLTHTHVRALEVSPAYATDDTLFAGTVGGVFRSTDRGDTWQEVNQELTDINILALGVSPAFDTDGTLFAGTWGSGVFRGGAFPIEAIPGDANGDGVVDVADLRGVAAALGTSNAADLNGDGLVDIWDLALVGISFGRGDP